MSLSSITSMRTGTKEAMFSGNSTACTGGGGAPCDSIVMPDSLA